ncbi:MAG: hypothetical protein WC741_04285 [Patescibacteria group bacterium]|jgi:hypothetical protein
MKNLFKEILIISLFFIVSLSFYYKVYWHELIFDRSTIGAVYGEVQATEWGMENIYRNLIDKHNLFLPITTTLYPFGIDVVGADAGSALPFIFFRPFLSPHQALSLMVVVNLILANIGMYLLLRKLKFKRILSVLLGLCYGYMTFLMPRLGHPGYSTIYLFPWFYYSVISFIKSESSKLKIIQSFFIVFFFVMTLWQNMYYFIVLVVSIFLLVLYYLRYFLKETIFFVRKNFLYLLLIFIFTALFLFPWLTIFYKTLLFGEVSKGSGWNGAIEFSSDIFGVFVPSVYNYYYGTLISAIGKKITFIGSIFENFNYPGIIIIIAYIYLISSYRKITKENKTIITPFFLTSLAFLILTLGPFLHVAGNWWIQLEDNIRLVFPLPFVFLHYLPFIGNIRAPGRLVVGFIFFAYIVCAYVIDYFLKNKSKTFKICFFVVLFIIFVIDHRIADIGSPLPYDYPKKLYSYIEKDRCKDCSVLEIPFSVRDGFTYLGDYNSIGMTVGQSYYKKPFIGGYSGRIPDYVKRYYLNNPLVGYLGRLIDLDIKNNPGVDQSDLSNWQEQNVKEAIDSVDFLGLKYIIVDEKNKKINIITDFLNKLGFEKKTTDKNYSLYFRELEKKEFLNMDLTAKDSSLFLGMGWNTEEEKFRWANRRSSVMFKINQPKDLVLNFNAASFYKSQPLTIYINKEEIGKLIIDTKIKQNQIKINKNFLNSGINTVYFIFKESFRPSDVIDNNLDERQLSGQFEKIWLTEK